MKCNSQIFTVLQIVVLLLTCILYINKYNEINFVWSYICEILICICVLKHIHSMIIIYTKYVKLLILSVILLSVSNILVLMFHESSKWIARPFFWIVALSCFILFFVYGSAYIKRRVKLSECFHTIVLTTVSLLISLPVYPYYQLSYSVHYHNGLLMHRHFVDGLYEENVVYIDETGRHSMTIKDHNRIIIVQYDVYPYKIASTDTIIIEHDK